MMSMCANGPLKQCGGGNKVHRWAAAGGRGKLPPKKKNSDQIFVSNFSIIQKKSLILA